MEIIHKPLSFLFILFIITVFFNLVTFSHSRATNLGHHNPKNVEDQPTITMADLTDVVKPVEPAHGSSNGVQGHGMTKDDKEGAVLFNRLNQGFYGSPYGYGYDNTYPGGIFGWPRDLFGFPRGLFRFPLGSFGYPGGYGGYPGGYDGYSGGYGGGQPGDKPGGGGYAGSVGAAEVKGK